jgi:hypothetical protein
MTVTAAEANLRRSDALHARVQRFIRQSMSAQPETSFDSLAIEIARFQYDTNPLVARLYDAHLVQLDSASASDQLPAIPTDLFRLKRVASHPAQRDRRCFETSGTTAHNSQRGRHPMRTTATYELAAMSWAPQWLWPDGDDLDFIVLAAPEDREPQSSLSFMLSRFAETLQGTTSWHLSGENLDIQSVRARCASSIKEGRRVLIAGTSFAFVHLCDAWIDDPVSLPAGSRIMQTGGFKGRSREVTPDRLARMMSDRLGIPLDHIVGEYGMTELGSQLYQGQLRGGGDRYYPPPWLKVQAVDPLSLDPVESEQIGIARFVDLANVDSSVAIQTADRVRIHTDGTVELLGRLPGAPPRGCSLTLEHLFDHESAEPRG